MRKLKLPGRDKSRPRLDEKDIDLIKEQGIDTIRESAKWIVKNKLGNLDTKDTDIPSAGNPVYKALHACNCTSREQLFRAHRIGKHRELDDDLLKSVVDLLVRWVVREYNFYQEEKKEQQKNLDEF